MQTAKKSIRSSFRETIRYSEPTHETDAFISFSRAVSVSSFPRFCSEGGAFFKGAGQAGRERFLADEGCSSDQYFRASFHAYHCCVVRVTTAGVEQLAKKSQFFAPPQCSLRATWYMLDGREV